MLFRFLDDNHENIIIGLTVLSLGIILNDKSAWFAYLVTLIFIFIIVDYLYKNKKPPIFYLVNIGIGFILASISPFLSYSESRKPECDYYPLDDFINFIVLLFIGLILLFIGSYYKFIKRFFSELDIKLMGSYAQIEALESKKIKRRRRKNLYTSIK